MELSCAVMIILEAGKVRYNRSYNLPEPQNILLCTVYVPPNSSETYLSLLLSYLTDLISSFKQCIFVGDFNFPDINWSSLTPLSNSFCEFIFDCNLCYVTYSC